MITKKTADTQKPPPKKKTQARGQEGPVGSPSKKLKSPSKTNKLKSPGKKAGKQCLDNFQVVYNKLVVFEGLKQ